VGKVKCVLREKIIIKKASRGEPSWTWESRLHCHFIQWIQVGRKLCERLLSARTSASAAVCASSDRPQSASSPCATAELKLALAEECRICCLAIRCCVEQVLYVSLLKLRRLDAWGAAD
jgi:hypothetical protein